MTDFFAGSVLPAVAPKPVVAAWHAPRFWLNSSEVSWSPTALEPAGPKNLASKPRLMAFHVLRPVSLSKSSWLLSSLNSWPLVELKNAIQNGTPLLFHGITQGSRPSTPSFGA